MILVPYFFSYKMEFFPSKTNPKNLMHLISRCSSLGMFWKEKTCIIAKLCRTDLVICSHS